MRTTLVTGAVLLIDDDGVVDIIHDQILEHNISSIPIAGSGPRLNPYPILSLCEGRTCYRYVLDPFFICIIP